MKRLYYPMWMRILLEFPWSGVLNIIQLSQKVNSGYSDTYRIVRIMEKDGLFNTERKGRMRVIYLTTKGEQIKKNLHIIKGNGNGL